MSNRVRCLPSLLLLAGFCITVANCASYGRSGAQGTTGSALRIYSALSPGYLNRDASGAFSGFIVDMLNAMAPLAGFTYTLKLQPDGFHGTNFTGTWNGLVGSLVNNVADVAATDLGITSIRDAVIDFTSPYMVDDTRVLTKVGVGLTNVRYLVLTGTLQESLLSRADDPSLQSIWANIKANNGTVTSDQAGVDLVLKGGFAYVGSVSALKPLISGNAQLEYGRIIFTGFAAFGVQQGSPLRDTLSISISRLNENGMVQSLINKWGI